MGSDEQTAPLDELLANSPAMLFLAGADGALSRSSSALDQALGYAGGSGASILDYAHPDDRDAMQRELEELSGGGDAEAASFECRLRIADGSYASFLCQARRAPSGGAIHGELVAKQRPDPELERSGALLKAIIENLDISIWQIDKGGTFVYHDGKGILATGRKPGDLIGKNLFDLYRETNNKNMPIRRALEGEVTHTFADGYGHSFETWSLPVRDATGSVTGAAGVSINITQAKQTEKDLRAKIDLIEQQQAAIRALSVPIIQVWEKVLTVPLIGIVDSARAAELMEKLLGYVARTRARFAVLDLTGVEAMDESTAGHMLRVVASLRLLGAEGILTGIRPSIATTMVGLGLDMGGVKTLATLRDGLRFCMDRMAEARGRR